MIRMEGVGKTYPRRGEEPLWALRDVNLRIRPGEYAALVGPSGSGKSTLMHLLGCLDAPTTGRYLLDGADLSHADSKSLCQLRREKIGFVFQGYQLIKKLTALENVAFPLALRGVAEKKRNRVAMEALGQVGMAERAAHRPGALSGGQQQRVAIARALCYQPKLLLCDEPTGALDTDSREEILALFHRLYLCGHTLVIITHDPYVASRAMRRFKVEQGQVREEGALTPAPPRF